jgi:hypothetical protein
MFLQQPGCGESSGRISELSCNSVLDYQIQLSSLRPLDIVCTVYSRLLIRGLNSGMPDSHS